MSAVLNPPGRKPRIYFYQEIHKGLCEGGSEVPILVSKVIVRATYTSSASYRP